MVNIPRSLFDRPSAAILKMRREVKLQKVKGLMVGSSSLSKPVSTFAGMKQTPIVVTRPTSDVVQDKSEWLISEDYSILQVRYILCTPNVCHIQLITIYIFFKSLISK